jgi:hypothetical protein
MIDTLLGKVAGLFEKDFLFASFLPALIFLPCLAATFALAVGIEGVWAWVDNWTALEKGVILAVSAFAVVIFAYVLNALRTSFAHFWSGESNFPLYLPWPLLRLGEKYQQWRFRRMRDRRFNFSKWNEVRTFFEQNAPYDKTKPHLPRLVKWELTLRVKLLYQGMGPEKVKEKLKPVTAAWGKYSGEDLTGLFRSIKQTLLDWDEQASMRHQADTAALDRQFGSYSTIRATKLGNIIASYNEYASKRYKMEAEIFWPRLQQVVKPEFLALVQEPRILLDFALTTTSLGILYSFLNLAIGPWLWFNYRFWGALAIIGFVISYFFYQVSVSAAIQLGEMMRASFDLFRLELMSALELPHPASFKKEQEQWQQLSELVVYGDASDFKIRERKQQ